ncbi:hypothetical protein N9242_07625, partial [Vicingaceae bacterium]|nr:hypothetical protein [Vicingaceae bacterium]
LIFKTKNYFKNSFNLKFDDNIYEFYAHKKLSYSIFKDGVQVAGISQERWNFFGEESFFMRCDSNCPKELFTAFVIIIDDIFSHEIETKSGMINANIGVAIESKPYNEKWEPK